MKRGEGRGAEASRWVAVLGWHEVEWEGEGEGVGCGEGTRWTGPTGGVGGTRGAGGLGRLQGDRVGGDGGRLEEEGALRRRQTC